MIESKDGEVRISGSLEDVMSDYALLIRHMRKAFREKGLSDDEIDCLFQKARSIADLTKEELDQKTRELEVQMMMKLFK